MKCNAGIWIDCKQLLVHTRMLVGSMTEFDREVFGKELLEANIAMIRDFALAYRLRDEHYVYDDSKTIKDFKVVGHKRECLDKFIAKNMSPHFVRYVDDTTIVTDNKEAVLAQIPELRARLQAIGIQLHPYKFYCQPATHGVEFLGYWIRPGRIHLKRRTIHKALLVAKSRTRGRRNYLDSINSYLGMIKATSDLKQAKMILDATHGKYIKDYENFKLISPK